MVLEDVEETITTTDIDEETNEEITKVNQNIKFFIYYSQIYVKKKNFFFFSTSP
jgi:hypothetical protein